MAHPARESLEVPVRAIAQCSCFFGPLNARFFASPEQPSVALQFDIPPVFVSLLEEITPDLSGCR